jgi:hypothetical protein
MARSKQSQIERAISSVGPVPESELRCRSCRVGHPPERLNANGRCVACRAEKQAARRARRRARKAPSRPSSRTEALLRAALTPVEPPPYLVSKDPIPRGEQSR